MLETVVASVLNRTLGQFVQDLDTEQLDVGLFSGELTLFDLKLKQDVLAGLGFPIELKAGTVGKVNMIVPWSSIFSQPVIVTVEDVYILAGPILDRKYDEEREKELLRAEKKSKLENLEDRSVKIDGLPKSRGFVENLIASALHNLQLFIRNVHIRYEDTITDPKCPFACGVCLQSLSAETTNNKWKPAQISADAPSIFKLVRTEAFCLYWNPCCDRKNLARSLLASNSWKNSMQRSLQTFSFNGEEFEFIMKPMTAKVKVIMNKSNEARVPKLLLDFVLQDAAMQLSRMQYISILCLDKSFQRMNVNRLFRKYHPGVEVRGHSKEWWHYAYSAVVHEFIRPYSWEHIQKHRKFFNEYKAQYREYLLDPNDTELETDLVNLEDSLDVTNIVIAREQAKIELAEDDPEKVTIIEEPSSWWSFWPTGEEEEVKETEVHGEPKKTLWSTLTAEEKQKIYDAIGYVEGEKEPVWQRQYIEHKLNFTIANCTLNLINRSKEIMVATLTQFLTSIETRPGARAFKVSTRTESFLIEGISQENDLISILTAENINSGQSYPHVLSIDFETNPISVSADILLAVTLELVEVMYNEHAVFEIMNFFELRPMNLNEVTSLAVSQLENLAIMGRAALEYAIARRKKIHLTLDINSPYLVFPEYGSLQRQGNVLVLDYGRVMVKSELQEDMTNLSDATRMELEERLYDRFSLNLYDMQILFCDSGDSWREYRKSNESEHHLIPKISCNVVFSNSVEPNYRHLPSQKLNVTIPRLKLNLSDRKLRQLLDFMQHLPLPSPSEFSGDVVDGAVKEVIQTNFDTRNTITKLTKAELLRVRRAVGNRLQKRLLREGRCSIDAGRKSRSSTISSMQAADIDKTCSASDHSDDEREEFARTIDLPGFDDNVSPHSTIRVLFRVLIGEVVIQLARSSNHSDKPYLLLRVDKTCMDVAVMEFGPAVQAGIGSIQLVDKFHTGPSGEYLELVSTKSGTDMVTLLYRKVRADCPDFKSHFHSVEQSLVVDFSEIQIIFHRGAFIMLNKYLEFVLERMKGKKAWLKPILKQTPTIWSWWTSNDDPPVPSGATKFSYSTRLGLITARFCDSDIDFMEMKISGLESDCFFKANERMVLRAYLTDFLVEDLTARTLYPKILWMEDDKVFDFKYVRNSPKVHKGNSGISGNTDNMKCDGILRLRTGRMHLVFLRKFFTTLQHFLEPFLQPEVTASAIRTAEKTLEQQLEQIKSRGMRLSLSLDFQAPTILIPQKSDSPILLVINMGDLSVENFFKEAQTRQPFTSLRSPLFPPSTPPLIDNILIRLQAMQMARAVYSLSGALEAQEPILEPASLRVDIKRAIHPVPRDFLQYEIEGSLDVVRLSVGQKDLSTMWAVWKENVAEGSFADVQPISHPASPLEPPTPTPTPKIAVEDPNVKKLQAFFSHSVDIIRETALNFTLEGLLVTLYADEDEVLSSPLRDVNHALCKFELEEISTSIEINSDHSLEIHTSLQSCSLEDIRPENNLVIRKIFQSYSGESKGNTGPISVSMPPMIDVTYKQNQNGDTSVDMIIEKTRFNVSVPFFLSLAKFIMDAVPSDKSLDSSFISHGFVGDIGFQAKSVAVLKGSHRPPSSTGSTSGYFSSGLSPLEEQAAISIAVKMKRPEVVLLADPQDKNSPVIVLRTEMNFDYSRNLGQDTVTATASSLHILSCRYGQKRQTAYVILQPCDVDFSKNLRSLEEGFKLAIAVSPLEFHISSSTVRTIIDVIEEVQTSLSHTSYEAPPFWTLDPKELEDLWTPKKLLSYTVIEDPESCSYDRPSYPINRPTETFILSMPSIHIYIEEEVGPNRIPVLLTKIVIDADVHDWTKQLYAKAELQLEAMYYNEKVSVWEPLIEPCMVKENVYRPWEVLIKFFQGKAFPIACQSDEKCCGDETDAGHKTNVSHEPDDSETSGDESDIEHRMMVIRKSEASHVKRSTSLHDSHRLVGYPGDSDSEAEDGILERIAMAFAHTFTGAGSEGDMSEVDESSPEEQTERTEEGSEADNGGGITNAAFREDGRNVFGKKKDDSIDSGLETENHEKQALYVIVNSRDRLEVTMTPTSLDILNRLLNAFSNTMADGQTLPLQGWERGIHLENHIGPKSRVSIMCRTEGLPKAPMHVLACATYDEPDSRASSPASMAHLAEDLPGDSDDDLESMETGFSISSALGHIGNMPVQPCKGYEEESLSNLYHVSTQEKIEVHIEGFETLTVLMPRRATSKLYALSPMKNNTRYYVTVDVDIHHQRRNISVRSPLQIKNETSHAISLFYQRSILSALGVEDVAEIKNPFSEMVKLATLEPDEMFGVPLFVAFHCKLFAQPAQLDGYEISEKGMWWQELATNLNMPRDFPCAPQNSEQPAVFAFRVSCHAGTAPCGSSQATGSMSRLIPSYLLRLLPPVTFRNHLPYSLELKMASGALGLHLEAGEQRSIYTLDLKKSSRIMVEVANYLNIPWSGSFDLSHELEEATVAMTTDYDTGGGNKQLGLNVRVLQEGPLEVILYAPYWIVNKTGLPIQLRGSRSEMVYESQSEGPILFRYKKRRRKKVRLRIYDSSWSSAFSMDTLGSSGLVVCRCRQRKRRYRILMTVSMSTLRFTKIITFLPCFLVVNSTQKPLRFMEENDKADLWIDIAPGECVPFWPDTTSMRMYVKFQESKLVSQHFLFNIPHRTVLRMDKGSGLCVEVSGGADSPFTTTFKGYANGDAVVRVDNLCEDLFLKLNQKSSGQVALLSPYQSLLYTWDDPTQERALVWNIYNRKMSGFIAQFTKDTFGQEKVSFQTMRQPTLSTGSGGRKTSPQQHSAYGSSSTDDDDDDSDMDESLKSEKASSSLSKRTGIRKDKVVVYWVSYLEGHQRVLLFTQDERVARQARRMICSEKSKRELFISFGGLGMSLANAKYQEVAYLSLSPPPAVWEVQVNDRWKLLTLELATWLEDRWQSENLQADMKDYVHVDFEKMLMTKPFFGELRRSAFPAVWFHMRQSTHQNYVHLRIHRLQLDNQLLDAIFPTVLCPTAIPHTIVKRRGVRPCLELITLWRCGSSPQQQVFRYIKVLLQEYSLWVDKGFLLSVYDIFANLRPPVEETVSIRADITAIHTPLNKIAAMSGNEEYKAIVEYAHISPVMIHFSFSPRGRVHQANPQPSFKADVLEFFLSSVGATLTEVKDVEFRLAFYEQRGANLSPSELRSQIWSHYMSQLLQQFYVLVLGLDVLGNPFRLVKDFTQGFGDFFYEPFMGALEGPEEFAEGVALGVHSLLGHVVGGLAGSVSLASGSLGGLLTSLTFDEDYKKRRRQWVQQPTNLPETMANAGRTFAMGIILGLTGVVVKPITGMHQEGVEGFFKGIGKGLLGLVTKPAAGVVDCVSLVFDGVRRAADLGEDVVMRNRLPRYMNPFMGLKPYSPHQARGVVLLYSLNRGHYAESDVLWAHSPLAPEERADIALITNRHVFLLGRGRLWGGWEIQWSVGVDDIMSVPSVVGDKLVLKIREDSSVSLFTGGERCLQSQDLPLLHWLQTKVEQVLILSMEDKPCTSAEQDDD